MTPWTFVHVADMQPGSPKSFRYAPAFGENWRTAMRQIRAIAPDLLLVGGDLTRDGSFHRYELEAMRADLASLQIPYHVVPGNMDTGNKHARRDSHQEPGSTRTPDTELNVTSAQLQQFASVFGPLHWSFVYKGVRFSGFADVAMGSGLPEEQAFWAWAEQLKAQPREAHHVWIMHHALFADDLREPNWDITKPDEYTAWYFGIDEPHRSRLMALFVATGADLVISGHIHCRRTHFVAGVHFDFAPATAFAQWAGRWPDGDPTLGFLRYDVRPDEIACTFVPLEKVSTDRRSYGLGGHPRPELRDYTLAWEPGGKPG